MTYDSTADTQAHIARVQVLLEAVVNNLIVRAAVHDLSKLEAPEKSAYDEFAPLLWGSPYGSPEYFATMERMKPALSHHFAHNSHHPEHTERGIAGMSLLDIVEMFADWRAASERHADGNFAESLKKNILRFGIDAQLASIFENTRKELGW